MLEILVAKFMAVVFPLVSYNANKGKCATQSLAPVVHCHSLVNDLILWPWKLFLRRILIPALKASGTMKSCLRRLTTPCSRHRELAQMNVFFGHVRTTS